MPQTSSKRDIELAILHRLLLAANTGVSTNCRCGALDHYDHFIESFIDDLQESKEE